MLDNHAMCGSPCQMFTVCVVLQVADLSVREYSSHPFSPIIPVQTGIQNRRASFTKPSRSIPPLSIIRKFRYGGGQVGCRPSGPEFLTEFQDRLLFGTDICRPQMPFPLVYLLLEWRDTKKITDEVFQKVARENAIKPLGLE